MNPVQLAPCTSPSPSLRPLQTVKYGAPLCETQAWSTCMHTGLLPPAPAEGTWGEGVSLSWVLAPPR